MNMGIDINTDENQSGTTHLNEPVGEESDLLQTEFISIVQQAKALYSKVKKKKGTTAQK